MASRMSSNHSLRWVGALPAIGESALGHFSQALFLLMAGFRFGRYVKHAKAPHPTAPLSFLAAHLCETLKSLLEFRLGFELGC